MLPTFKDSPSRQFSQPNPAWGWGWPCCCGGGGTTTEHGLLFGGASTGTAGLLYGDLWSYDDTGDTWTAKTGNVARSRHFASKTAADLTVWAHGFPLSPAGTGTRAEQYVPSVDTWTSINPTPTVMDGDSCATTSIGHIRFGGDTTGGGFYSTRVDAAAWTSDQPLPSARGYQCQSYAISGDAYVVGGNIAGTAKTSDNLRFHASGTGSWTTQTALFNERALGSGASVPGVGTSSTYGFVMGGIAATGTAIGAITNEADEYDPTGDAWTLVSAMPATASSANAFVLNNIIYNLCGSSPSNTTNFAYNSSSDSWSTKSAFPGARRNQNACTAA